LVSADFGAESFAITWIPGRDNALVNDGFRILPIRASICDIGFDGLKGGRSYYDPSRKVAMSSQGA
jgi:hypothetical protein